MFFSFSSFLSLFPFKSYIEIFNENDAPVLLSNYLIEIGENSEIGNIGKPIVATDEDASDTATYEIVSQPVVDGLRLFSFSSLLQFPGQVVLNHGKILDFESPTKNQFKLQMRALDSGSPALSAEADLTVQTVDVNESPQWTIQTDSVLDTIDENSAAGLVVGQNLDTMVFDPDVATSLIFTLENALACDNILTSVQCNTAGDEGFVVLTWFHLDQTSGKLTLTEEAKVDFELLPKFRLTVKVTDNGLGNLHSSLDFFILVNDMPESPQFAPLSTPLSMVDTLASDYLTFSINEYVAIDTIVVNSEIMNSFVHDHDVGDTFTFTQVFGTESESVLELTNSVTWSKSTAVLNSIPFWLAEEGTVYGWFSSTVANVDADVLVPHGATVVRISLRYWSIGDWDSIDNEEANVLVNGESYWTKRRSNACDGWNEMNIRDDSNNAPHCFYDVEVDVPVRVDSPWQCVAGFPVPMRINEFNDVECYSKGNKHCEWEKSCTAAALLEAATHEKTSLSCGEEHKAKWGKVGYNNIYHWCYKGKKALKQSAQVQVSVQGQINDVSGTVKWGFSRFSIVSGGKNIGSAQPLFKISPNGIITTARPLRYNDAASRTFSIQAMDSAGLKAEQIVTVAINDINQAPVFLSSQYVFSVLENSIGGIAAESESIIQAYDDDENQALTYSVDVSETSAAAALMFDVQTTTVDGENAAIIVVKPNVDLDYETQNNYTLALVATDSAGSTSMATATIILVDVNEPPLPKTEDFSFWVRGETNQPTVGTAITPNDPDADDEHDVTIVSWGKCTNDCDTSPTFTEKDLDEVPFRISASKFTLFVPSYIDAVTSIANGNRFQLVITVEDSGGEFKTVTVDIQVTFQNHGKCKTQ